ncbi:MAG: class I SAM-dependent methyltransferase [Gammaproteobacteria bacterium]|nr:class I SAM-dependent methyltransferase [Gammaproteobacteria bacterium]
MAVLADNPLAVTHDVAADLAQTLNLPLAKTSAALTGLFLTVTETGLELRDGRDPRLRPLRVDFTHLDLRPYSANLSRRQPLTRAMGKKSRIVIDATAGYCQDALLLTLMGFRVSAVERSPVVTALARDGLRRFEAHSGMSLSGRLQLFNDESRNFLLVSALKPDAIYLDPMFPAKRKKSAAIKKEMRWLRDLVGDDADAADLLAVSRRVARDRVVVKRPDDAAPLAADPSMSLSGKLVRYDVYLTRRG